MSDLAELDIKIDSRSAAQAKGDLDKLDLASQKVERSTEELARAQADAADKVNDARMAYKAGTVSLEGLNQAQIEAKRSVGVANDQYKDAVKQFDKLGSGAKKGASGVTGLGDSSKLASHHMLNLGYQINDVIVGLTSGQKPMTVFTQQGAQIAQIGAQAGVGLGGMAKAVGGLAVNLIKAHPVMAALAVAGTAAGIALNAVTDSITNSADIDGYSRSLGLTNKEMKKLTDVHVTFGDVFRGVWKTINDATGLSELWDKFTSTAGNALTTVGKWILDTALKLFSSFEAAFTTIKQVWSKLPAVIGDAAVQAANAASNGIESLVNASIDGLNKLAQKANELTGLDLFGTISHVDIPAIKNQYAGAAKEAANTFTSNYQKQLDSNRKGLKSLGSTLYNNIVDQTKGRLSNQADQIIDDRTDKPDKIDKHAAALARDAAATEAQIDNLYDLAKAYGESGAAALIAEARLKAESKAIKDRADIEARVAQQVRVAIAERVSDAAKATATMREQATAQEAVNEMVAAGNIPAQAAARLVKDRMTDLPLLAAIEAAKVVGDVNGAQQATKALAEQRAERERLNKAEQDAVYASAKQDNANQLATLQKELELTGATTAERVHALAVLKATQDEVKHIADGMDPAKAAELAQQFVDIADAGERNAEAERKRAGILDDQLDALRAMQEQAGLVGDALSGAFGKGGAALGQLLQEYVGYAAYRQEQEAKLADLLAQKGEQSVEYQNARKSAERDATNQEMKHYSTLLSSAKGLFKERSAGYQAITVAEKVLAALQLANAIKSMITDTTSTATSVANSATRGAASAAAGAAKMFESLGPFGFAAVAAMVALLASMGLKGLGGGGGGVKIPTAEDYQKVQGTGTVLGDPTAQSESLNRSLEIMLANSNKDLEYSNLTVRYLKSIEGNIGNLASLIAREGSLGGGLNTAGLGLGTNTSGGLLGVGGLFSKSVTKELNDSGITFSGSSVGEIIAQGITANLYQEVLKTTKKSGFLGIGGSTKTSTETTTTAAGDALTTQVQLLIGNLRDSLVSAAGTIGVEGAQALLDAFQVDIGRVSFKGLSSDEIEKQLQAVFSKVGDDMANAIAPGLAQFQKAGEGLFETLNRLAKDYTTVDVALKSIGLSFGQVGTASLGARESLISLFGGLDDFVESTNFFRDNFLSEAERMAPIIDSVRKEMDRLGLSSVDTKEEFKQVVLGLDLSTDAGQQMYAALLAVAPAFLKTTEYMDQLNGTVEQVGKTAEQLAAIEKQRRTLEIALMDATGNSADALAARRTDELAGMDESLRALQQQVYAATDAAQAQRDLAAAEAAAATATAAIAKQRRDLEIQLMEATGDAAGALAAKRADELAAMDESLRGLQGQVYAAQDAATAAAALAQANADTAAAAQAAADAEARLSEQRRSLDIQLMEATGDSVGALAAKRQDELDALDPQLRSLQQQVYAAQDAAAANAALASAQAQQAQAAEQAAQAAAQAAAQIAAAQAQVDRQRTNLEIELLKATGQTDAATAKEREVQLGDLDPTLRDLQKQVYAAQDAAAAAQQAAAAQAEWARQQQQAQQEADRAAQEAARNAEELRRNRVSMEIELLELTGNAAGALALRRQEELAAMDASLRPLQMAIYAQQDLAAATDAVNKQRDVLSSAYERESGTIQEAIDKFTGLADSLRKYRDTLSGAQEQTNSYAAAQAKFVDASAAARQGNADALASLQDISETFLAASRERASSLTDYQLDVARVSASVTDAIGAADAAVDYAKLQLDALNNSVQGLIQINESVVTVHDAIIELQRLMAVAGLTPSPAGVAVAPVAQTAASDSQAASAQASAQEAASLRQQVQDMRADLNAALLAIKQDTGQMSRQLARVDAGDSLRVSNDPDTPLYTGANA